MLNGDRSVGAGYEEARGSARNAVGLPSRPKAIDGRMVQPEQWIVRREHRIHHVAADDVVTGVCACACRISSSRQKTQYTFTPGGAVAICSIARS